MTEEEGMKRISLGGVCAIALLAASAIGAASASATSYGVMAWGWNVSGELGNGTTSLSDVPVAVSELTDVTAVSTGQSSGYALLSNGEIRAWGSNEIGNLGNGSSENTDVPVAVSGVSEATAVSASFGHAMALLTSGTVVSWGENTDGDLGVGTFTGPEKCPKGTAEVPCSKTPVEVEGLSEVTAISAGAYHSLALLGDGTVMAWGRNEYGQLGNGTTEDSDVPVAVNGLSNVIAISAGYEENLALLSDGTVMAWGRNQLGQLGDGTSTGPEKCIEGAVEEPCSTKPIAVSGLSDVAAVSAGYWNEIALLDDGTVTTWGQNRHGQLGIGNSSGPEKCTEETGEVACSTKPIAETGLSGVTAVVASQNSNLMALLEDGRTMTWGLNVHGQLGNGSHSGPEQCLNGYPCSTKPVEVKNLVDAVGLAAGGEFDLAMVPANDPPEYGRCIKIATGTGHFGSGTCTSEGGEKKYEWYGGVAKRGFTTAAGETKLENVAGTKIVCNAETGEGEYQGRKAVTAIVLRFQGCQGGGAECKTAGAAAGEIVTRPLEGVLGIETASIEGPINDKIALDVFPVGREGHLAETERCGLLGHVSVRGAVLGRVTSNTMALSPKLKYKAASGKQKPEGFEGQPADVLEMALFGTTTFSQAGLSMEATQTNEEKVEINSVV
jgi:alpha-tubulin suppressor-like RCC1 family protein